MLTCSLDVNDDANPRTTPARSPSDGQPHIHDVCQKIYDGLSRRIALQIIQHSGETGAGKTHLTNQECQFFFRTDLTGMSSKLGDGIQLIECLGKASTRLNVNSSRFARSVTITFDTFNPSQPLPTQVEIEV
ncbi:hypothetical protein TREMEDRAFT_57957 [Tremella mesenterica DSM 1558]|uniref:uncharacterized protein n=1 Tax=Tremella mesenterica (strain ATCC 24925 / CBS 8224 / DSM 1558 / NBRC 9311 / NRRL Y-6157 / RJB 2259-6 / UBC 559-6) TaxID=578456 RepID=UPI00032CFDF9|nr:uncharacterized protein TREMEDRAFT_57957 [Tremella mesenterica DSM 1558]EIW65685.1 hypothetical protein TREMEDRAFT_57957 [Tremella mesenterica DSM 1558]